MTPGVPTSSTHRFILFLGAPLSSLQPKQDWLGNKALNRIHVTYSYDPWVKQNNGVGEGIRTLDLQGHNLAP